MAKQPFGGRPNKAALTRIKITTGIVAVVTFLGSVGAIATFSPGTHTAALSASNQTAQVNNNTATTNPFISQSTTSALSRQSSVVPLTRTRGS